MDREVTPGGHLHRGGREGGGQELAVVPNATGNWKKVMRAK